MRFDFSGLPLREKAYSRTPEAFLDRAPKSFLSAMLDLALIETGDRAAREFWQHRQLQNLLAHAHQRSPFWRKRIGTLRSRGVALADLPVLSRAEIVHQVETEGPLVKESEFGKLFTHSTSGSSGTPVSFFQAAHNSNYHTVRNAAQYFIEGRDLSLNRTRFYQAKNAVPGFKVETSESWMQPLATLVRTGLGRQIEYFRPDIRALCRAMEQHPAGYLVIQPRLVELILQHVEPAFFARIGTAMLISIGEAVPPEMRAIFAGQQIPVRGTYSSEEIGTIGFECERVGGSFHVATSNVIVEVIPENVRSDEPGAGRVLLTNLHSYATPFIRYDVGDIAILGDRCACGHDGPALSGVSGRAKMFLKHDDGRISPFHVRASEFTAAGALDEYRVRQTGYRTIVVEIGGRTSLSSEETSAFANVVRRHAGEGFDIEVRPVASIDWGPSSKRLGFVCEI